MLESLIAIAIALVPFIAVAGLLVVADRVQRRRESATARQVSLTNAIHQELGAVAAPRVERRAFRPWRVLIPVPFDQPRLALQVMTVAHRAMAGSAVPYQIVLVARAAARGRR